MLNAVLLLVVKDVIENVMKLNGKCYGGVYITLANKTFPFHFLFASKPRPLLSFNPKIKGNYKCRISFTCECLARLRRAYLIS